MTNVPKFDFNCLRSDFVRFTGKDFRVWSEALLNLEATLNFHQAFERVKI